MEAYSYQVETIAEALQNHVDWASMILGLSLPLPRGGYIQQLELQKDKKNIYFDILIPVDTVTFPLTAQQLITLWEQDPALKKWLHNIELKKSQREELDEKTIFRFTFQGKLS